MNILRWLFDWLRRVTMVKPPEGQEKPVEQKVEHPAAENVPKPPDANVEAGDHSFIWKPVSDNDGKLAVITPCQYTFSKVIVRTVWGDEAGRYTGRANGNRQHWRYKAPGSAYGNSVKVVAIDEDGAEVYWEIPDSSKRFQQR